MLAVNLLLALTPLIGAADQVTAAPQYSLEISTVRYFSDREGGKRIGTWRALKAGQPIEAVWYNFQQGCGFILNPKQQIPASAVIGWRLHATPVAITNGYVVIEASLSREVEDGKRVGDPERNVTLRLRTGDVVALDSAVLPRCQNSLATFVISLKAEEPSRPRAVATDLWLVHKGPDGVETSQHQQVRGGFSESSSYAFDELKIGSQVIDVFGTVKLRPSDGEQMTVELNVERQVTNLSQQPRERTTGGGGTTDLALKPGSVTAIDIPLSDQVALKGHSLSLRIKSQRIR